MLDDVHRFAFLFKFFGFGWRLRRFSFFTVVKEDVRDIGARALVGIIEGDLVKVELCRGDLLLAVVSLLHEPVIGLRHLIIKLYFIQPSFNSFQFKLASAF